VEEAGKKNDNDEVMMEDSWSRWRMDRRKWSGTEIYLLLRRLHFTNVDFTAISTGNHPDIE